MFKKISLLFFSLILSLVIVEFCLKFLGRYNHLTTNNLKPSQAIYERAHSSIQNHRHPDINHTIVNFFDKSGVKNFDQIDTSEKKNIIGIFGDSFVENIAIDKDFEYSQLLNERTDNFKIVNYGIGGYSADQVFIRYLRYKDHEIKHVFFLLMPGDQGFSTKSIFKNDGEYKIDAPKLNNFYHLLGKLNLTYLFIDIYYYLKSKISKNYTLTNLNNYNSILANKIYEKFYHPDLKHCKENFKSQKEFLNDNCAKNLINLLHIFRNKVVENGSKFYILVYPNLKHIDYFNRIINEEKNDFNFYILNKDLEFGTIFNNRKINFKNDAHWNEYGNVVLAENMLEIFDEIGIKTNSLNVDKLFNKIDKFYKAN